MFAEAIIDLFSKRSSLENPSTPLTGARINEILGGGMDTSSGISVNSQTVLTHPVLFRGVSLVAGDVSKLPIFVYQKNGENREKDLRHPASVLLRKRANMFIKSQTFFKTMIGHACLHRGGYAHIKRNGRGQPTSMDILPPEATHPVVVEDERAGQQLIYQSRDEQGRERIYLAENVFHVKGLSPDGLDGYSVIDKLKEAIGAGLATQKYAAVFFGNNASPRVVIRFPGYLKTQEAVDRFRASWGRVHGGVENQHKPAILEGGAEIQPFSLSNQDSQFLETRQLDVRILSSILGIPPHKLGDNTRTSFASLEQENQSYLDEAIDPWLREIETECNEKLLSSDENLSETVFVEFVRSAFVRTNQKDRFESYAKGIQAGFMSRAQARQLENWNVDDPALEEFLQPLNMVPAGEQTVEEQPAAEMPPERTDSPQTPDHPEVDTRLVNQTEHLAGLLMTRIAKAVDAAARQPDSFLSWLDRDFREKHMGFFINDFGALDNNNTGQIVADIFDEISEELLEASGRVHAPQLRDSVGQIMTGFQADLPSRITQRLLGGSENGTPLSPST